MTKRITENHDADGVDRRGFLDCMAWAGAGVLWTISGGVASSQLVQGATDDKGALSFVQISDSHIGFSKEANKDVAATLREAVAKINAMPSPPAFILHTGDIAHLSKPGEFDTANEILKTAKPGRIFSCRANTMFSMTAANFILSASAKTLRAVAGTASTRMACIFWDS